MSKKKITDTKSGAIRNLIRAGFSDETITATCKVTKGQLGAYKAWVTMGK